MLSWDEFDQEDSTAPPVEALVETPAKPVTAAATQSSAQPSVTSNVAAPVATSNAIDPDLAPGQTNTVAL
jgi:hypothetical protein